MVSMLFLQFRSSIVWGSREGRLLWEEEDCIHISVTNGNLCHLIFYFSSPPNDIDNSVFSKENILHLG